LGHPVRQRRVRIGLTAPLSNVSDPRVVMASVALIGICHAASTAIVPYFVSRFFGLRSYSEIYGYSNAMIGGISSIAPILLGLYFDAFHSYQLALTFMTAAFAICTVIAGFLPAYAYRVGRPGDA
jgi:hypothetical protein